MSEVAIPGKDDEGQIFRQIVGHYGPPAYMRRANQVEEAWQHLLAKCRHKREEMLTFVRLRLATLKAQAGDWQALEGLLAPDVRERLEELWTEWKPTLRIAIAATSSAGTLRATIQELWESVRSFNRRWQRFVTELDLSEVNRLREGYNKYYILEKECALRSPRLARVGFQPLASVTTADVLAVWPCVEVPGW